MLLVGQIDTRSICTLFHPSPCQTRSLIVFNVQRNNRQGVKVLAIDHRGFNDIFTELDHATTTDGREGSIMEMLNLKHDTNIGRKIKAFTIRQCERFVVEYTVKFYII